MPRLNFRRVAWMIGVLGLVADFSAAASTLADFVPHDAGVCLSLEEAAPHVDRFVAGPLYGRLNAFPPLAEWRRENVSHLNKIAAELSRQLGVSVPDAWRHIFGRQTLLAIWPPNDARQKQGSALLLVEADEAQLLARLVAGIHSAQERAGDVLESHDFDYRGVKIQSRLVRRGESSERIFLATLDRIGVLTNQQRLMEQVVDLRARGAAAARLSQLPAYQEAMEQIDAAAPAKLFLNPRIWDAALARAVAADDKPDAPGRQLITQAWRSLRYAVFAFSLHPQARAEGYLAFQPAAESAALSEVLGALTGPAVLLERTPADALAAAAGTADITRLVRWINSSARPETGRRRGLPEIIWSLVDGTFQGLGPGFGGFLMPPHPGSEFPLAAAAAVQIQQRVAARQANALTPAEALRSLLQASIALAPPRAGEPPPELKSEKLGQSEILTLSGLSETPPGVSPSFAFSDRTMFVGLSPQVVQTAATLEPAASLAAAPRLRELLGSRLTEPSHVGYVNLLALRHWLAAHGDAITALLAGKEEGKLVETRRGLEQLHALLSVTDHAAAAARIESTGIRLSASVMVAE